MSATSFRLDSACLPVHRLAAFEQTIIDGIQDLMLVLAPDGRILHASQMCFALTTLAPEQLIGNHITTFMHYDDLPVFLDEFNSSLLSGRPWRFCHRLRRADDSFAIFESILNPFIDKTTAQATGLYAPNLCVMTIRPYSNPSVELLDSYLDHITTQARLTQQLEELRSEAEVSDDDDKEEEEEQEEGEAEEEKELVDEQMMDKTGACTPNITNTKKKVSSNPPLLILTDLSQDAPQIRNQQPLQRPFAQSSLEIRHGQRSCSFKLRTIKFRQAALLRRYRNPNHHLTSRNHLENRFVGGQTMREKGTEEQKILRPYLRSVRDERIARVAYRTSRQKDPVQCLWT